MSARKAKKRVKTKRLEREHVKTLLAVIGDFDPKSQRIIADQCVRLALFPVKATPEAKRMRNATWKWLKKFDEVQKRTAKSKLQLP